LGSHSALADELDDELLLDEQLLLEELLLLLEELLLELLLDKDELDEEDELAVHGHSCRSTSQDGISVLSNIQPCVYPPSKACQ
jgi:hypothetical protein